MLVAFSGASMTRTELLTKKLNPTALQTSRKPVQADTLEQTGMLNGGNYFDSSSQGSVNVNETHDG